MGSAVGRPRRYCRRSHRQRAFEARRAGAARGLGAGEAIVPAASLEALRDARYLLETALDDVAGDLAAGSGADELRVAYDTVVAAAAEILRIPLDPEAVGDE